MKNLDIKYASAQNFLCFGSDVFEIDFHEYGNVVLVKGSNYDVVDAEDRTSSNGVGKSSIPEIIVYTLFGKTIKHPKKINHKDVINNKTGKSLRTEVKLGNLRIVRTRKPDSLRVWESDKGVWDDSTEITLGGQPATQKLLEDKIGLNYETFVNVVVFTDNNSGSFLESDASSKREIVENLLSIEKYKNFAERAKNMKKDKKEEIKIIQTEYDSLKRQHDQALLRETTAKDQEKKWKSQKEDEIKELRSKLNRLAKEAEFDKGSEGAKEYEDAQNEIESLNSDIVTFEQKHEKARQMISAASDKLNLTRESQSKVNIKIGEVGSKIKTNLSRIKEIDLELKRLEKNEGAKCKYCFGVVSKENYKKYASELSESKSSISEEVASMEEELKALNDKYCTLSDSIKKINAGLSSASEGMAKITAKISEKRTRISELNKIKKPQSEDTKKQLARQQVKMYESQIEDKTKELKNGSPFQDLILSLSKEISDSSKEIGDKSEKLDLLEKELPYYEFWSVAFGDSGIRKFIIDGIMPALNSKIAHWMQFLIDGKISLEFNNELEEKIERSPNDGDPFVYYAMSGGERRRLNLAVSQAFAHVMMLSSGTCPSLVFLDEVTTNIDQIGVVGVHNMIMELAKDRRVFITTHDQNLLEMLEGCELINLEKRNGFTRMKNSD